MRRWVKHLVADTPELLTWDTEPAAKAGDMFVFSWRRFHYRNPEDGELHKTEYPDVYLRLTANPKRRRTLRHGYQWTAPYIWGIEQPQYLDRGGANSEHGLTRNRLRSPDPEAEAFAYQPRVGEIEANRRQAEQRRREIKLAAKTRDRRPWRQAA